jgi:hypothetical protein
MQTAIAQADSIFKFIRSQVQYGLSMQNWQQAALDADCSTICFHSHCFILITVSTFFAQRFEIISTIPAVALR